MPTESIELVMRIVCEVCEVTREEVTGNSSQHYLRAPRTIFCKLMRQIEPTVETIHLAEALNYYYTSIAAVERHFKVMDIVGKKKYNGCARILSIEMGKEIAIIRL